MSLSTILQPNSLNLYCGKFSPDYTDIAESTLATLVAFVDGTVSNPATTVTLSTGNNGFATIYYKGTSGNFPTGGGQLISLRSSGTAADDNLSIAALGIPVPAGADGTIYSFIIPTFMVNVGNYGCVLLLTKVNSTTVTMTFRPLGISVAIPSPGTFINENIGFTPFTVQYPVVSA